MVEIRSPFPAHALPRAWSWLQAFRSRVADDFGPQTVAEWVDRTITSQAKTWGVYRDGELGGMITFERLTPWLGTAHCMFRQDFWGRPTTRPAVKRALEEMFGSGIGKLTFLVFSDNRAIRSLLMEFGAVVEGAMKGHTLRGGQPVDMKALAIFKETFYANGGSHSSDHRGSEFDHRGSPLQPQEAADEHDHTPVVPGDAAVNAAVDGPQLGTDVQSGEGSPAD